MPNDPRSYAQLTRTAYREGSYPPMDAITNLLIPTGFVLVGALLVTAIVGSFRRSPTGRRQVDEARARRLDD